MKGQGGRKAIVLLSDGIDDGSASSLDDALSAALRSDTLIYGIHVFNAEPDTIQVTSARPGPLSLSHETQRRRKAVEFGRQVLMRISQQTGGGFFEMPDAETTASVFTEIEAELRSQYNLGFTPPRESSSPGLHSILLTTRMTGTTVQTKNTYVVERSGS
jgi:VWFA-related protein